MTAPSDPSQRLVQAPFARRLSSRIKLGRGKKDSMWGRGPWPHQIRVKFVKFGGRRGRGGKLMRLMTCPICGKWWERPVASSFGCTAPCQVEAAKYRVYFRKWFR